MAQNRLGPGRRVNSGASSAVGCLVIFGLVLVSFIVMGVSGAFDSGGGGGSETETDKQARALEERTEACRKGLPPGAPAGGRPEAPVAGEAGAAVAGGQARWTVTVARCVPLTAASAVPKRQTTSGMPFVVGQGDVLYGIDPATGREIWHTDLRPRLENSLDGEDPWYIDDAPDAEWMVVERNLQTAPEATQRSARLLLNRRTGEIGMVEQGAGSDNSEWYAFGPDTVLRVRDDGVVRVDPRTGAVRWRVAAPNGRTTPPYVLGGTLFLHGDGMPESETIYHEDAPSETPAWGGLTQLRRIDLASGNELPPLALSEPVKGQLYASDGRDTLLMRAWVDPDGAIAVDARTGKVLWRQRGGIPEFDPLTGTVGLVFDGGKSDSSGARSVQSLTVVDPRTGAQRSYAEFPQSSPLVLTGGLSVRQVGDDKAGRLQGWTLDGKLAWDGTPLVGSELVARTADTAIVTACRPDPAAPELCTSLDVTAIALK